jgi:hypothetical protein
MKNCDPINWNFSPDISEPEPAQLPFEPFISKLETFAMNEISEPQLDIDGAAKFIGMPANEFVKSKHWPLVLAKWRFMCAEAMVAESQKRVQ